MILSKIWERYIFFELLKFFAFFLCGFYFLYVVIDYSIHMQDFVHGKNLSLSKIFVYYIFQFVKRADILLPLSMLIGSIKVLCQLNVHRELVAFQSAGLKIKKLLRPFFLVTILCFVANLAINQYVVPHSLNFIDKFYDAHLRHSYRGTRSEPLHVMHLDDHSKLVYQYYDAAKETFFDVIWMRNADNLWRMKYLKADPQNPQGQFVDHLVRSENGGFEKIDSFPELVFSDLAWEKDLPRRGYIPFENRSIIELWQQKNTHSQFTEHEKQGILTQFLFKLIMPLLSSLCLIAVAPYCWKHTRYFAQFFIYACAIFAFVAFIALMDATVILGENDTVSPYVAILSPFILLFSIFGWRFAKK